jgi:diamine N-acetyltransferase
MVGLTMYWFDPESGTGCIDRLMVAAGHQGRGYGRAAMTEVIRRLKAIPGCRRIRTAFGPTNAVAEAQEGELVAVLEVREKR